MNAIDLYCGCGGLSLGFKNAGVNIVAAFDNWTPAIETYRANIDGHPAHCMDLSNPDIVVPLIGGSYPDIIIGGPPCQDFSSAGKRDENGGRADLTLVFARIVTTIKPRYFMMENVARIVKSKTLPLAKIIYREAGYGLSEFVLDASFCGVPQQRKRFFLFGELNGSDSFLDSHINKNRAPLPMTLRDYFGNSLGIEHYYRHPRSYARRAIFSINEPSPTIRGVNRPIPNGYPGHSGDTSKITSELRPLTTQERAQIQTFPKDFVFKGTKAEQELMIGNAVPVNLAYYVANALLEYHESHYDRHFRQNRAISDHAFRPFARE